MRKVTRLTDLWLVSPMRKQYATMECDARPDASPHNLNLWQGMAITTADCVAYRLANPDYATQAKPFFDHLRTIWCKNDEACFTYVMCWFAMTLQRPQDKIGVAIVVVGGPGGGKGVIMSFLAAIIGEFHLAHVMGCEQLLGKFNFSTTRANKLTLVDECTWAGRKEDAAKLKAIITEETAYMEKKFMDGITVRSISNLVFFSNDSFAVHVEGKDRRYFSLETDNRYSGVQTDETYAYFKQLRDVPKEAVASMLYELDLSAFRPRQFPHTSFRQDQQTEGFEATSAKKWFLQCLESQQLPGSYCEIVPAAGQTESLWQQKRIKHTVYEDYKAQAGQHAKPAGTFWKQLAETAVFVSTQERKGAKSVMHVQFKSQATCRARFMAAMGAPNWKFDSAL